MNWPRDRRDAAHNSGRLMRYLLGTKQRAPYSERTALSGTRFGLYLSEHVSDRELRRLCRLATALHEPVCLGKPKSQLLNDIANRLGPPATSCHGAADAGTGGELLDAVIVLCATRAAERCTVVPSRYGTWATIDGDPRSYSGPDAIGRAVAEGRDWIGMSLRLCREGPCEEPILAFCDVPRRPRDTVESLQERLDAHLPLLLEDAVARLREGRLFFPATGGEQHLARPRPQRWGVRLSVEGVKYLLHLAGARTPVGLWARRLRMICLHDPTPDILDRLLSQLRRFGPFLAYGEAVEALRRGRSPRFGWVVTFDDGYKRNLTLLDVLDEHRCQAKFFLTTVGLDGRLPWFINRDVKVPGRKKRLKALSYSAFLRTIDEQGLTAPSPLRGQLTLTAADIRALVARGHEDGVHTHNHPFLTQEGVDIRYEILTCYDRLRAILDEDRLPLDVAYPDGDYDEHVVAAMHELGVRSAVTCRPGALDRARQILEVPRYCLGDADYSGFALFKTSGLYPFLQSAFHFGV